MRRLLIPAALLSAGFAILLYVLAGWESDNQPMASGTDGLRWENGATQSYRLSIISTVRLMLPGEAAVQALEQELSGTLGMKVFTGKNGQASVGFQLSGASYTLNGQRDEVLTKRLELPFTVLFERNGRPLSFQFPQALQKTERTLLEESVRTFQVIIPAEAKESWSLSEEHSTGRYLAHYRYREDGSILKRKTLYTALDLPDSNGVGEPMEAHLEQSLGAVRLAETASWLESVIVREKVSFSGGNGMLNDSEVRAELVLIADGSEGEPPALFAAERAQELIDIANETLAEVLPLYSADTVFSPGGETPTKQAKARNQLEPAEVLAGLFEELGMVEKAGRISLLKRIEKLLALNPELSYQVAEQVRGHESSGAVDAWLMHVLERSGTPEAQDALSMVMGDPTYRNWNRVQAAVALGGVEEPTDETLETLLSMARSRNSPEETDIANASLLAVGSLGKTLSATDYVRAQQVAQELTASLYGSRAPAEEAVVLKAMENMGEPALGETIQPYLEVEEPFVRSAAANALGRLKGEGVTEVLSDRLPLEDDRHVRSSIVIALGRAGGATENSLASVKELVLGEPEANTRYHMTKYLGDHIEGYPENKKTLQIIALKDPSARVRQYARKVLIEVDGK